MGRWTRLKNVHKCPENLGLCVSARRNLRVSFEFVKTRRGFRLEQNGCVLSEVLRSPGPTNSVFDFLALSAEVLSIGPRWGLLGFAAGGLMAPLRAVKSQAEVFSVDLSREGFDLFEEVGSVWKGALAFDQEDAVCWLRAQEVPFDVIIEDLSMPTEDDVEKPSISWEDLPVLMRDRIAENGVVVTNVLKSEGMNWEPMLNMVRGEYSTTLLIHLQEFENKILVQTDRTISPSLLSRRLRQSLRSIGSDQADQFRVQALPRKTLDELRGPVPDGALGLCE
jgi:hypothetical protein